MNRAWLFGFVLMLVACSGTESGNPTRGGVVCPEAPIELTVTDAKSGAGIPQITVNGSAFACAAGTCKLSDPSFAHPGEQQLLITAPGYAAASLTVSVPASTSPLCTTGTAAAEVVLQPNP